MLNQNEIENCRNKLIALRCCVIVPTYNNDSTLLFVLNAVHSLTAQIIVVNDGSTDSTSTLLAPYEQLFSVCTCPKNAGKGIALQVGFEKALKEGYNYAITIDSDGQHFAEDIISFIEQIEKKPQTLLVGARNLQEKNMPKKNTFGNKFSNFWFWFATGIKLPDTQSGFRLYPLDLIKGIHFFTSKFEFELEVLVKSAWQGVTILPVPIKIFYAKGHDRVSHFRPGADFIRISFLNIYLVSLALIWHHPKLVIRKLFGFNKP